MKKSLLLLSSSLALLVACNMPEKPKETPKEESTTTTTNKKVGLANNRTNTNAFPKSVSSDADRRIAQDVQKAIAGQKNVAALVPNIRVSSSNGVVQLKGNVPTYDSKEAVANVVRNVPGVRRVDNQLEVRSTTNR